RWPPGTSGNPAGHSRGRRIADAVHRLIDKTAGLEDKIATTVTTMALGAQGKREPDLAWFKLLKEMIDGPTLRRIDFNQPLNESTVDVVVPVTNVTVTDIDPAVAERILAAADPTVTMDEGDEPT